MVVAYSWIIVNLIIINLIIYANSIDISWNISAETNDKQQKVILNKVFGESKGGTLHALIGPSGSGKTTLLNALAGIVPKGSLNLYGSIYKSSSNKPPIFVQQEDLLFTQLTVKETLNIAASLKLINENNDIKNTAVDNAILKLGLKKTTNTPVGDAKTRGVSGGEKKRLSIGNELIGLDNENLLILADEPTSGLDSYQAQKVIERLSDLAKEGNTVLTSIHQPRSSIFNMFDYISLLSEGKIIYSGSKDEMIPYFTKLGFPCPNHMNPPEYYIDLVSIDYSTEEDEESTKQRINNLADSFTKFLTTRQSIIDRDNVLSTQNESRHISKIKGNIFSRITNSVKTFSKKFAILLNRAWIQIIRDKSLNIARLTTALFSSLLFGSIYFKMKTTSNTVADRLGLLQVAAINTAMTSLIKATTSFVTEKFIVRRERKSGLYTIAPYFFSKLLAEFPISAIFPCISGVITYYLCGLNPAPGRLLKFLGILVVESLAATALGMSVGSIAPSVESAIAVAPAVMVIFIVFGGLYVVNTPFYLKWVPNASLIRWAYEALCVNEFAGLELQPLAANGPLSVTKGEQVLQTLGYQDSSVKGAVIAQFGIVLANYAFTYFSLWRQKPTFEKVKPFKVDTKEPPYSDNNISDKTNNIQSSIQPAIYGNIVR